MRPGISLSCSLLKFFAATITDDDRNQDVQKLHIDSETLKTQIKNLEAENNNLRELVEDMRRALQTCDAKCLALLVESRRQAKNTDQLATQQNEAQLGKTGELNLVWLCENLT